MKRYAVFAHYDPHQKIDDYVLYYLSELKSVTDEIVFVSDGPLSDDEKSKLKGKVNLIIAKRHGEYDFGSYKLGIKALEQTLAAGDQLVLCNDSAFGPFVPFKKIFDDMTHCDADMWGIIDASDHSFLMSFFLVLNSSVFLQDYFKTFFANVHKQANKNDVVLKYEIGFSKLIRSKGQKLQAWFDTSKVIKCGRSDLAEYLHKHNIPKYFIPHRSKINVYDDQNFYLQFLNFPFLKKLVFNDKACFFPVFYKTVIKNYPLSLIDNYVERVLPSIKYNVWNVGFHKTIKEIKRFLYHKKMTKNHQVIIRICKIPVYCKRIGL